MERNVDPAQLRAQVAALHRHFEIDLADAPEPVRPLLATILDFPHILWRSERYITLFGTFKAGKTTLLNALLGAPVLPVRANRATGVVTRVRYAREPVAEIVRSGDGGVEPIDFDSAAGAILLQLRDGTATPAEGIEEVRLGVPLPFLHNRCVLVDTPGLLDQEVLNDKTQRMLEETDLAIMVLPADKVLSARERESARAVHRLLHGHIAFVINRLNLIDEEDREEIIAWVERSLEGLGSPLLDGTRIFPVAGPAARARRARLIEGVAPLQRWLEDLLDSPDGERMTMLSRLSILRAHLQAAQLITDARRQEVRATVAAIERASQAEITRKRAEQRAAIADDRQRLRKFSGELPALAERFVADTLTRAENEVAESRARQKTIRLELDPSLEQFATSLVAGAKEAVNASGLPLPAFDPNLLVVNTEIVAATNVLNEVGASIDDILGRVVGGANLGSLAGKWIGKNVLGVDAEVETRRRIEAAVRSVVPTLQREAAAYLERVDELLRQGDAYYQQWTPETAELREARGLEERYTRLADWCRTFLRDVEAIGR